MNYIISLGGSLIVPRNIDIKYLLRFRDLVVRQARKGKRFLITTGGGATARTYQSAARKLGVRNHKESDWLGIEACMINAQLLHSLFASYTTESFFYDPKQLRSIILNDSTARKSTIRILIASGGLKPGGSSDSTSIAYAKKLGIRTIINLTNVAGVFDRDPNKFKNARLILRMTWREFIAQFGTKRHPGQHKPFDPSAAKLAARLGIKVVILNGRDIRNLRSFLRGKIFKGTLIE